MYHSEICSKDTVDLGNLTATNGGFLIELVYNNSLVGFLDIFIIQLCFVDT